MLDLLRSRSKEGNIHAMHAVRPQPYSPIEEANEILAAKHF